MHFNKNYFLFFYHHNFMKKVISQGLNQGVGVLKRGRGFRLEFPYKLWLITCSACNQTFRRQHQFTLHLKNCIDDKFVPSFVPNITNSDTSNNTYQNTIHDSDQKVPKIDDNEQEVHDIDLIVESKSVLETPSLNWWNLTIIIWSQRR